MAKDSSQTRHQRSADQAPHAKQAGDARHTQSPVIAAAKAGGARRPVDQSPAQ